MRRILREAVVDLNDRGLTSSAGLLTEWKNRADLSSAFGLDVLLGTVANLRAHPTGSMLLDGAVGSYASTPDSPAASITGDITLIAYAALADWTPPADDRTLVSKFSLTGNQRSYLLRVSVTTGRLEVLTSATGSSAVASDSGVSTGFVDGAGHWVRASVSIAGDVVNFYTSDDSPETDYGDITWSQLGAVDIAHVQSAIFDSTASVNIGAFTDGADDAVNGLIYKAGVISGTDATATPAVSFNAADGANKNGLASDTFFGAEMLTASARIVNLTDWSKTGTGSVSTSDGITTLVDTDTDAFQTRFSYSPSFTGSKVKLVITLAAGTAGASAVRVEAAALYEVDWSDGSLAASGDTNYTHTWIDNGDGTYTLTVESNNTATSGSVDIYVAGYNNSATGDVRVIGDVSLQAEFTLNGNAFMNNLGHAVANTFGGAGMETTAGQTLSTDLTVFMVAKAHVSDNSNDMFINARSDASKAIIIVDNSAKSFGLNAGTGLTIGPSDTEWHLFAARYNRDSTTSLYVSGLGTVIGDAGSEDWDALTILSDESGANTLNGAIANLTVIPRSLTDTEYNLVKNDLINFYGIAA